MDNQFVPKGFEKILISLGFDYTQRVHLIFKEKKYYGILWQQAFDWFRDNQSMSPFIRTHYEYQKSYSYHLDCEYRGNEFKDMFNTYEEARLECLKKLIEIIKNK